MSSTRVGPFLGPTAGSVGAPRSRANVREVPLANPANLIIGVEYAVLATCTPTASPIASAEPSTRSKRSRSDRASSTVSRASSVVRRSSCQQRAGLRPEIGHLAPQLAQRVEHAHQHDDERGETDRAEHRGDQDREFAGGHDAFLGRSASCGERSRARRRGGSVRTSDDRRARRARTAARRHRLHDREDSRSPRRGRSTPPPCSANRADGPAPRRPPRREPRRGRSRSPARRGSISARSPGRSPPATD